MPNDKTVVSNCPRCDSPDPKRHPAMQFEGEVQLCRHSWHQPTADEIEAYERRTKTPVRQGSW